MKQFNWNDAPEGTTDRCTETDVWIRIAGDTIFFWNIGTEKWEATSLPLRPQWLMKKPAKVTGNVVVLTGRFNTIARDKLKELLTSVGYNVKGSVNGNTDLLVYGECSGSKLHKARQIGVSTMDEGNIIALLHTMGVQLPPALKPEVEQKRVNLYSPEQKEFIEKMKAGPMVYVPTGQTEPMTATEVEQKRDQHLAKIDAQMKVTRPGLSLEAKTAIGIPTEMMLTRPIQFTGGRGGTQFTFPIRTLVNVVGKTTIPNTIVLHHQPTLRYAVVDKSAVEPVISEEEELIQEACAAVDDEGCCDATVEALIKAGYRKQPETSHRFKKVETIKKNPNTKDSVCEPGLWVACIEDTHGTHMEVIGCNGSDKAKAEELRDYVLARLQ